MSHEANYGSSRHVITTAQLKKAGLYCGPDYRVNLVEFQQMHRYVLPDGRRFCTYECAANFDAKDSVDRRAGTPVYLDSGNGVLEVIDQTGHVRC